MSFPIPFDGPHVRPWTSLFRSFLVLLRYPSPHETAEMARHMVARAMQRPMHTHTDLHAHCPPTLAACCVSSLLQETADVARRMVARAVQRGASRSAAVRLAASAIGRFSRDRNSKDDITVIVVDLAEQQGQGQGQQQGQGQGQGQGRDGQQQQQQQRAGFGVPVQQRQAMQPVLYQEQQQQQGQQGHQHEQQPVLHLQALYPPETLASALAGQAGSPHESLLHLHLQPQPVGWPPGCCAAAVGPPEAGRPHKSLLQQQQQPVEWPPSCAAAVGPQEAPCGSLGRYSQPPHLLTPSMGFPAQGLPHGHGQGHGQGQQQQGQGQEQQVWGAAGPQAPACTGVVGLQGVPAPWQIDTLHVGRCQPIGSAVQLARGGGQRHWMAGGCSEAALAANSGQRRPEALPQASLLQRPDTPPAAATAEAAAAAAAPPHLFAWGVPSLLATRVAAPAQEQEPGSRAAGQATHPLDSNSTWAPAQQTHLRASAGTPGALHPAPGTRADADTRLPAAASAAGGQTNSPVTPSPFSTAIADTTEAQRPDLHPWCVLGAAALAAHQGLDAATAAATAAAAAASHGPAPPGDAGGYVPVPPSASLEHWTPAPELLGPPPSARSLSETSTGGPPSSGERRTSGSSSTCSCCCTGQAALLLKPSSVVHSPPLPGRVGNGGGRVPGGGGVDSSLEPVRRGQCHVCRGTAQVYGSGRPVPYRTQSGSVVGQRQGEAGLLSAAPRARGGAGVGSAGVGLAVMQQQEQQQLLLQQLHVVGGPPAVYGGGLYRSRSIALRLPL